MVPKYQRYGPDGRYARVRIGGRDIALGPYDSPESREKYRKLVGAELSGRAGGVTVAELAERYTEYAAIRHVKGGKPTRTVATVVRVMAWVAANHGSRPAADFGLPELAEYQRYLITTGITRETINSYTRVIPRAFRWAANQGLVPASVWVELRALTPVSGRDLNVPGATPVLPATPEQIQATIAKLHPVTADVVRLQLATGLRPAEACGLLGEEVDRSEWVLRIRPDRYKVSHHDRRHVLPVGPRAREILGRHPASSGPVFLVGGRPLSQRRYYGQVVAACLAAVVPLWTPRQLRHNYATEARKRFGVEKTRVMLGHSDMNTTEIYAERDIETARKVAEEIG